MNNLPKVVTQQRRSRASNPRLLDRKSDALPLSHRAIVHGQYYRGKIPRGDHKSGRIIYLAKAIACEVYVLDGVCLVTTFLDKKLSCHGEAARLCPSV